MHAVSDGPHHDTQPQPRAKGRGRRWEGPLLFLAGCLPLAWLAGLGLTGGLGANPIEAVTRELGTYGLTGLMITLAATPAKRLFGWGVLLRHRRMAGLFAFFYVCLHVLSYVGLDQFFHWPSIWADIVKRLYITLGMVAVLMLIPLAVTSTDRMIRRLGGRRWRRLHTLIYPAAVLGVVHYWLMIKADWRTPALFALVLGGLLGARGVLRLRRRNGRKGAHVLPQS